jgi:hypothetical protein
MSIFRKEEIRRQLRGLLEEFYELDKLEVGSNNPPSRVSAHARVAKEKKAKDAVRDRYGLWYLCREGHQGSAGLLGDRLQCIGCPDVPERRLAVRGSANESDSTVENT